VSLNRLQHAVDLHPIRLVRLYDSVRNIRTVPAFIGEVDPWTRTQR
jgi:hypothetical protein